MKAQEKVLILTPLPFRKHGNQSLIRFVDMLISEGFEVVIASSGKDLAGENQPNNPNISLVKIPSTHENILNLKVKHKMANKNAEPSRNNFYNQVKSETVIPPFGYLNIRTLISKWVLFSLYLIDNILLLGFLFSRERRLMGKVKMFVGYECGYTLTARLVSNLFHKPYINKYQGTVLKATGREMSRAIKYFPNNYFGINASDLCIMVNDGTDGKYYAERRGCKNIYFEPHGVATRDYQNILERELFDLAPYKDKFIIFNNASGSRWKRVDRIVRAMQFIQPCILDRLIFLTTYKASDRPELMQFAKDIKVDKYIVFLDNIDHRISNYLIQKSQLLVMTNDMSNLGNPVLEAIYYGTPIISINDGSLDGFLINGRNSILLNLDEGFDKTLAHTVEKCIENPEFYFNLKVSAEQNHTAHTLEEQQSKEIKAIRKVLTLKCD